MPCDSASKHKMISRISFLLCAPFFLSACEQTHANASERGLSSTSEGRSNATDDRVTISVVSTNDLHGAISRVAIIAGFVKNLRELQASEGGGVMLLDAGDMWQGTLESNLGEGRGMVQAFNAARYDAAAIGNHEFDYGPVGDAVTPTTDRDNPRGALFARAAEAKFSILTANLFDRATRSLVDWPNISPTALIERAGVRIGVIGVTTEATLRTTIRANVRDIRVASLSRTIKKRTRELRRKGARIILVLAHAGGKCSRYANPDDLSSCEQDAEIFRVARALPKGSVDAIFAGHTHGAIAHRVNGIPIIEAYSNGHAFGRIDFAFDTTRSRVVDTTIHPPQPVCQDRSATLETCRPGAYEGKPVVPDAGVLAAVAHELDLAKQQASKPLNVRAMRKFTRSHDKESSLGNLMTDLMRAARPTADVAVLTTGGVRAPILPGPITYGEFYQVFPFDNRFASLTVSGKELESIVTKNLRSKGALVLLSGIRVHVRCRNRRLVVRMSRSSGHRIKHQDRVSVLTSDFLATGGDGTFTDLPNRASRIAVENEAPIREALVEVLMRKERTLDPSDKSIDPRRAKRMNYLGNRPLNCVADSKVADSKVADSKVADSKAADDLK